MWPFGERFPYSDTHELNLDWILKQIKLVDGGMKNLVETLPNMVADKVAEYIEEHPATGIPDNSIETTKLKKTSIPVYCVTDYNILPDTGDVYRELHSFIKDVVYNTGGIVYFPKGKYTISYSIFIPENTIFIGDGPETEIYFDETDTTFGVALCNAGSNVKICNMTVSQLETGDFHAGAQAGCIGLGIIAPQQCLEPPYSHNFISRAYNHDITVEDVYFVGKYALQCEPTYGKVSNLTYRNIITEGCVSLQCTDNAVIENVNIENCTCDLVRFILGSGCKNIAVRNTITNSIHIENNSDNYVYLENVANTANIKKNDYGGTHFKNLFDGNSNCINCNFQEDTSITYGIIEGRGIHKFDGCSFNFPNKRAWSRNYPIAANTNYSILNDCLIVNASTGSFSVILGYGKNNKYEGNVTNWLFGDIHISKNLEGSISGTNTNTLAIMDDRLILRGMYVVSTTTLMTLPATMQIPIDRSLPVYVVLFNSGNNNIAYAWAKFTGNDLILIGGADIANFNRCMIDTDLRLTRTPTPEEISSILA